MPKKNIILFNFEAVFYYLVKGKVMNFYWFDRLQKKSSTKEFSMIFYYYFQIYLSIYDPYFIWFEREKSIKRKSFSNISLFFHQTIGQYITDENRHTNKQLSKPNTMLHQININTRYSNTNNIKLIIYSQLLMKPNTPRTIDVICKTSFQVLFHTFSYIFA